MVRSLAILLCVTATAMAAPVPRQIQVPVSDLIRDLAADDARTRDAAETALAARGFDALAPLSALAERRTNKDVVSRAERLLAKLQWGLYTGAPRGVVEAVERYHSRTEWNLSVPTPPPEAAIELVETVALLGRQGAESLRAIARTLADERGHGPERWRLVQVGVRRAVGRLLFDGKEDDAAAVLTEALPVEMARDVRAWRQDRGLPVPEEKPPAAKAVVVANVFQNVVAERIEGTAEPRKTDRAEILLLQGDPERAVKSLEPADRVRLLAARWRFSDALAVPTPDDADDRRDWTAARAAVLFAVGRTDEAVKTLDDSAFDPLHSLPAIRVEVANGRVDRAFERVANWLAEPENRDTQWTKGDIGRPRTFWGYPGDPDFAEVLFPGRKLAACAVWAEYRKDCSAESALALTRRLMAGTATKAEYRDAVARLGDEPLAAVTRAAGDATLLEKTLRAAADNCHPTTGEPRRPLGLTVVDDTHFGPYLAYAHTTHPILDHARLWADRGRHKAAAEVYLSGWKRFPNSAVLLYLSGRELTVAGDTKEGGRRTELAFHLLLADGDGWAEFLQQLLLVDAPAEHLKRAADRLTERPPQSTLEGREESRAHRDRRMAAAQPKPQSVVGQEAFRLAAEVYRRCGAFEAAAKAEEQAAVCWSSAGAEHARTTGGRWSDRTDNWPATYDPPPLPHPADYLRLLATPKLDRAVGLLAAKKPSEARKLAADYFALLPGDVVQAVRVMTAFDKAGATKEADELFASVRAPLAAAVKQFPNAVALQRSLTELLVGCGREKK